MKIFLSSRRNSGRDVGSYAQQTVLMTGDLRLTGGAGLPNELEFEVIENPEYPE